MQILKRARAVLCLVLTVILAVAFVACGEEKDPDTGKHEHVFENGICSCGKYEVDFITSLPMSQSLQAACDEAGTVVTVSYPTRAYAYEAIDDSDVEIPITKKAQIYLPYGYDENTKYDIVYLMHGAGETYEYWLTKMGTTTRNVLDNMIKNGLCDPVIAVATSWVSDPASWEETPAEDEQQPAATLAAVAAEEGEEEDRPQGGGADLTGNYPIELRNDIIPFIESNYPTYAEGDTSPENLKATREHRAFAGFSMGSMTSIEVLKQCPDLFYYIGSYSFGMSGEAVNEALSAPEYDDLEFGYWFNQNGSADFCLEGQLEMVAYVRENMTDKFTDGKNFAYIEIPGGSHAYNCWIIGLYNSLLVFFK